jgi:serine/threonine protein phosphatase 1
MSRTFVTGDIHGALKALRQVMAKIVPQEDDRLIFLGDYVDGWSQSQEVIQYLIELEDQVHCIFIKGNHDIWCEEWLQGGAPDPTWLIHGGKATIKSYAALSAGHKKTHLEFFNRMCHYIIDPYKRLFIHAGFTSMHGPEKEQYESMYSSDRTLWEMALALDTRIQREAKAYPKRLLPYREIYIGHTPTTNYDLDTPMQAGNVWNIDTGAAFTGKLTVLNVDTKEFWQSDTVPHLYPGEKGRNR